MAVYKIVRSQFACCLELSRYQQQFASSKKLCNRRMDLGKLLYLRCVHVCVCACSGPVLLMNLASVCGSWTWCAAGYPMPDTFTL